MFRKTIATCLSVLALGAGALTVNANAAPNGNIVTFGDSYTSNPDELRNTVKGIKIPQVQHFVWGTYPSRDGCLQAPNNWPRMLGRKTGAPISDYSCTAESSHVIPAKVDRAIRNGDIHRGTRAVVIAVGINDYGPWGIGRGANPFDQPRTHREYVGNIKVAVDKIRRAAPNAKILLPGTLSISEPYRLNSVCLLVAAPNMPIGLPLPTLQRIENYTRDNQRAAARATGATYIEIKDPSAGHNTCALDKDRWVVGVMDPYVEHNMNLHPSPAGSNFIADQVARNL